MSYRENFYEENFQEFGALDEGRFSTVFRARAYKDDRFYAIKKIPFDESDQEITIKEISIISKLSSNYVVKYIDHWIEGNYYIGTTDDSLKLISLMYNEDKKLLLHIQLELCSMPLNYVIKILNYNSPKNSMNSTHFGLSCEILIQLLECVNYLHTLKPEMIIHQDLKPENIMLVKGDNNRFVKLIDFGLSTYHFYVEYSQSSYTGTRQYRAPEVYSGKKFYTKSDIYSLGLIMQELFNLDFNNDNFDVDEGLISNYENIRDICVQCLESVISKRPTCKEILDKKDLWAYFSPEEKSIDSIRNIVTEKYQILFQNEFEDYQIAINTPYLLDAYSKALVNCFDRKQMLKNNFKNWRKLITVDDLNRLFPVIVMKFGKNFEALKNYFRYITDFELQKEFIFNDLINVNDENEFQILIQCLLHTGNDVLAFKLYPPCIDMNDFKRCDPRNGFTPQFRFGLYNKLDTLNRRHFEPVSAKDCYPMDKIPRGFCYLLINYFTVGTYREMQRFRNIFYQLHFKVIMKKNLSAADLRKDLINLSKSDELKDQNAFIFLSISHGNQNNEICGFDGNTIPINEILEMFNNENCVKLQNKPKMFFFNCCRGKNYDFGVKSVDYLAKPVPNKPDKPVKITLPTMADFIICYSTLDGLYASVDWYKGTEFGQAFANALAENAWSDDICTILTKTNGLLAAKARMLEIQQPFDYTVSGVTQLIKFFPFKPHEIKLVERVVS